MTAARITTDGGFFCSPVLKDRQRFCGRKKNKKNTRLGSAALPCVFYGFRALRLGEHTRHAADTKTLRAATPPGTPSGKNNRLRRKNMWCGIVSVFFINKRMDAEDADFPHAEISQTDGRRERGNIRLYFSNTESTEDTEFPLAVRYN